MKRIIAAVIIVTSISTAAAAQTSGSTSSNSASGSSHAAKPKNGKAVKGKKAQADSLDDRKTYKWKDGQQATPTGHEATGIGGSAAVAPKDSATARPDSTQH